MQLTVDCRVSAFAPNPQLAKVLAKSGFKEAALDCEDSGGRSGIFQLAVKLDAEENEDCLHDRPGQ